MSNGRNVTINANVRQGDSRTPEFYIKVQDQDQGGKAIPNQKVYWDDQEAITDKNGLARFTALEGAESACRKSISLETQDLISKQDCACSKGHNKNNPFILNTYKETGNFIQSVIISLDSPNNTPQTSNNASQTPNNISQTPNNISQTPNNASQTSSNQLTQAPYTYTIQMNQALGRSKIKLQVELANQNDQDAKIKWGYFIKTMDEPQKQSISKRDLTEIGETTLKNPGINEIDFNLEEKIKQFQQSLNLSRAIPLEIFFFAYKTNPAFQVKVNENTLRYPYAILKIIDCPTFIFSANQLEFITPKVSQTSSNTIFKISSMHLNKLKGIFSQQPTQVDLKIEENAITITQQKDKTIKIIKTSPNQHQETSNQTEVLMVEEEFHELKRKLSDLKRVI